MFIFVFGIWVIRVANLGAMDDRDLAVVGYYRNDDVGIYGTFGWTHLLYLLFEVFVSFLNFCIVIFCMNVVVSYNIVSQGIFL